MKFIIGMIYTIGLSICLIGFGMILYDLAFTPFTFGSPYIQSFIFIIIGGTIIYLGIKREHKNIKNS